METKRQRDLLGEDGELRQALDADSQAEPIYCTRCGTPNPARARYCRKCGHSLEEQEAEMIGLPSKDLRELAKAKNDARQAAARLATHPESERSASSAAVAQVMTMLCVAGMAIAAIVSRRGEAAPAVVPLIIGWFLVEAVRGEGRRRMDPGRAIVTIFTVMIVAGIFIGTVVTGQWPVTVPLIIGWFLIEAVRRG
jgi:hypothetical protein